MIQTRLILIVEMGLLRKYEDYECDLCSSYWSYYGRIVRDAGWVRLLGSLGVEVKRSNKATDMLVTNKLTFSGAIYLK